MKIPKDMICGSIHITKNSGALRVISYKTATNVLVRFESTGTEVIARSSDIRRGGVKDHMRPCLFGVGFYGKRIEPGHSRDDSIYSIWAGILERCYCPYKINSNISYKDCFVDERWHNYQNFKSWHDENYIEGYHIDKDIITEGNKTYSPDRCIYVPRYINNIIEDASASRGDFRVGVSYRKDRGKFRSYISIDGRYQTLGHYNTEKEAGEAYDKAKYEYVKLKCEQCKSENPNNERLYWAMDILIDRYRRKAE